MIDRLRRDIARYPDIFWLRDPLTKPALETAQEHWNPPLDLITLWSEFGTGEMFESEVILRPFADSQSVEFFTDRERQKGLPLHLVAFHYGIFVSAFDLDGFHIFDTDTYECLGRFNSLDDWYVEFIWGSWSERYGLSG